MKEKKLDEEVEKGNDEFLLAQELLSTVSSSLSEAIKEENMIRIAVANELMFAAQKIKKKNMLHRKVLKTQFKTILERKENLPLTPC